MNTILLLKELLVLYSCFVFFNVVIVGGSQPDISHCNYIVYPQKKGKEGGGARDRELHPLLIPHTCCCPSCTSCKPICFANSAPKATRDILFLTSRREGGKNWILCSRQAAGSTAAGSDSCSPELGGHLRLAAAARYLSGPSLVHGGASVASGIRRTFSHHPMLLRLYSQIPAV